MPRKRKGPKREPSEGDPTAHPHPTTSSRPQQRRYSATLCQHSTHRQPTAEPSSIIHRDQISTVTRTNEHVIFRRRGGRLGKLVGLERWLESVGHGRGAAVCVCGEVVQATPSPAAPPMMDSTSSSAASNPMIPPTSHLSVTFKGELASNARSTSSRIPLRIAANLLPAQQQQQTPRAAFLHQNAVLKMSPQPPSSDPTAPTSAIWIEQLATPPTLPPAADNAPAAQPPHCIGNHTSARSPALSNPQHTTGSLRLHRQPRPALPALPSQCTLYIYCCCKPDNTPATTTAARQTAAASTSAAPGQPPSSRAKLSLHLFLLASSRQGLLQAGPAAPQQAFGRASIIGVVMAAGDPRRSSSGTRDLSIKITMADASVSQIQMFGGKPQAVGKSSAPWSWATMTRVWRRSRRQRHDQVSRPTLKLKDVGENNFLIPSSRSSSLHSHLAPDLYVSDYTNHALFYRGNDSDIIRIQNVRPKLNPRGLLTGGLGSSTDSGIKIRTLKPTDEARIDLEKRRARFLKPSDS
ncbi:uncharacterized protein UTRI_02440 [Ustilago trichophora]|uniref:Uncharacterized protein n=1 Tax=Ustilago trichophora TaxID=86804 RepID=A0A5C3E620_9BASI|nr:uncharacterized protein UTRI_02440 [Ustilago trichophora]